MDKVSNISHGSPENTVDDTRTLSYRRLVPGASVPDRWSLSAICALILSTATSPPAIDWLLATIRFEAIKDQSEFTLAAAAAVIGFVFAVATAMRISRRPHLKGMRFALPAVIMSFLTCAFHVLISLLHGPD